MCQAGYHQANALAQRISQDIKSQSHECDNEMLAMSQVMPNLASSTYSEDAQEEDVSESYQA